MMGFIINQSVNNVWIFVADQQTSCLLHVEKTKGASFNVIAKWQLNSGVNDPHTMQKVAKVIPKKAKIAISLSSDFFQLRQFSLDKSLSRKEQTVYIKAQMAQLLACKPVDVLLSIETVPLATESEKEIIQSALALDKTKVPSIFALIQSQKLQSLRLESIGQTLSWLVFKQNSAENNRVWAVLECLTNKVVLLIYSGTRNICQKEIEVSVQMPDFAIKLSQKVKQILVLCSIQQPLTIFSTLGISKVLVPFLESSTIELKTFNHCFSEKQSKTELNRLEFYALALSHKLNELN